MKTMDFEKAAQMLSEGPVVLKLKSIERSVFQLFYLNKSSSWKLHGPSIAALYRDVGSSRIHTSNVYWDSARSCFSQRILTCLGIQSAKKNSDSAKFLYDISIQFPDFIKGGA